MSTIQGISGVSDSDALSATNTTSYGGQDLDQAAFMNLLTTQMQNQDPLDPMANEEFIAQLATFSSLEQLMSLNGIAQAITMGINSLNNAAMADLVGKHVVAKGDEFSYSGAGDQELMYDAQGATTSTTVTVYDEDGSVVYTHEIGAVEAGEGTWTWDGKTTSGATAEEGTYTFEFTGENSSGESVTVDELIAGVIDEMDYSTGSPQPSIDGVSVDLGNLIRLATAESAAEAEESSGDESSDDSSGDEADETA